MNSTVETLRSLDFPIRIEKVVDLAYSDAQHSLSTNEYLDALDLSEEALREIGSTEEGNFSVGDDKKWHTQQGPYTITSFSAYEIQEDERDEYFAENLSPGRYAEISSGNELTTEEKKQYADYLLQDFAESGDTDSFTLITLYQLFDSQNRSIRFRQEIGDGAEIIITDGPLLDEQNDLDGFGNSLFVPYQDEYESEDWEE